MKRDAGAKTFEERNKIRAKLTKFRSLAGALLSKKKKGVYTEKALQYTTMMLKRQPDFHTIWNYRRDILNSLLSDANDAKRNTYLKSEFEIVEYVLSLPLSFFLSLSPHLHLFSSIYHTTTHTDPTQQQLRPQHQKSKIILLVASSSLDRVETYRMDGKIFIGDFETGVGVV